AGPELAAHGAGHARLRRAEQRLDVAAHRIEMLALVDQIAIDLRELILDARLRRAERQLLELAVRGQQDLGGRRLERDAALRADDRVAEMDPAADRIAAAERLEPLDQRDRVERRAVDRD